MGMFTPTIWPEGQINGNRQLEYQQLWQGDELRQPGWSREEDTPNFITPETSHLSYDSSANSGKSYSSMTNQFPSSLSTFLWMDNYASAWILLKKKELLLVVLDVFLTLKHVKSLQDRRFINNFKMLEMNFQI